ncbi:MAG TPA: phenylalanine--tRNA ligase subunit beta [Clostridiales bacterium]|nr:phenylalanine--tRNA ligase subunit beta [Clostridiales bacterium]
MILSLEWLSEFVDIEGISVKEFSDVMTMTGSKVEGWEELGADIKNVVAGRILSLERHPDSDHLWVCKVDIGEPEPRQIVTGAQNLYVGAIVPVAAAPAELPGGVKINKAKLRGVESDGMLCSISELGLTEREMPGAVEDGIFILSDAGIEGVKPGDDIPSALRMRDIAVEFEITPNRPDCLSVIGLAREAGASLGKKPRWHTPSVRGSDGKTGDYISVSIKAPELCPRYTARVVKNVKISPSPLWMRMRLRAAGVRPINNIVDITNYVMLEYGQPMHAFDYACLHGKKIIVREAEEGEQFRTLDGTDHTLRKGMLVIADEERAVALAGIMGGENSEITENTTTVVFESANFEPSQVRLTSRALGVRTESSSRFEKGLDPENTLPAIQRACELVELLGAGEVVGGPDDYIDVYPGKKEPRTLPLNAVRINQLLGLSLDADAMAEILRSLEFDVRKVGDSYEVGVPSWRGDVEGVNDLAEEVLRIYGYDKIASTLFTSGVSVGSMSDRLACREQISDLLINLGLYETCTFSFVSPKIFDMVRVPAGSPLRDAVRLLNPLGEDTSIMRTMLLPSVLEALAHNYSHRIPECALFENAPVYINRGKDNLPDEPVRIAIAMYGPNDDFYSLKGICEAILGSLGITGARYVATSDNLTYHPGRCATIKLGDAVLGVLGELHPEVLENFEFDIPVYGAELDFEALFAARSTERRYVPLPRFPAVSRDLAFVCDERLESQSVADVVAEVCGALLENIKLFDVYRSPQLGDGKKSLAFALTLRAADRTLSDEEVDELLGRAVDAVREKLGAQLRL